MPPKKKVKPNETLQNQVKALQQELAQLYAEREECQAILNMKCAICLETCESAVRLCPSGHYCCATCTAKLLLSSQLTFGWDANTKMPISKFKRNTSSKCPSCRVDFTVASVLKERKKDLPLQMVPSSPVCGNEGCSKKFATNDDRLPHALACRFISVTCTYCKESVSVTNMPHHVSTQCHALKCRHCVGNSELYTSSELSMHYYSVHRVQHKMGQDIRHKLKEFNDAMSKRLDADFHENFAFADRLDIDASLTMYTLMEEFCTNDGNTFHARALKRLKSDELNLIDAMFVKYQDGSGFSDSDSDTDTDSDSDSDSDSI